MAALTVERKTAKVVILMPLPVDTGDEPMKAITIIIKIVAKFRLPKEKTEKPVLRKDRTWNKELTNENG